jgi:Zn-dependent protease/CBS domain-containing protein
MNAFRIGKLFGIDIRVDWSWLFIVALLTWNLSAAFFVWHPRWSPGESVVIALIASILFFACILIHELAHSIVAQLYGVKVRSITLFLFGGVSNIEHEPPSPRAEFFTAIVGPITSIVLGILLTLVAAAITPMTFVDTPTAQYWAAHLTPAATLLTWLGPINILIGIFNLIPAFPLDGGRVLRSILWAVSGDLRSSTRHASIVGQVFGWLLIVLGIAMVFGVSVPFFGTGLVAGLWLAFIGWFLRSAAALSYGRIAIDDALAGHTVQELMRRTGPTVPPELPLATLVHDYLIPSEEGAVPVVRDGSLLGLVSLSDVRHVAPAQWPATTVGSVMSKNGSLVVAKPDEPLSEAFEEIARHDVEQLPVLDHGRLVGMLLRRDLGRWLEATSGATSVAPASRLGHTNAAPRL